MNIQNFLNEKDLNRIKKSKEIGYNPEISGHSMLSIFKWLRDEKNISIKAYPTDEMGIAIIKRDLLIDHSTEESSNKPVTYDSWKYWGFSITDMKNSNEYIDSMLISTQLQNKKIYDKFFTAIEAGIEYALDNSLINKN